MTKFKPCIDLHDGKVKQIVGGTLSDDKSQLKENYTSDRSSADFADLYKSHDLTGGHIIQLGPGNKEAALSALNAWHGGMQLGGGVNIDNAADWISAGASHVIVTSWLFSPEGKFLKTRLKQLADEIGKEKLVVDLSCRRTAQGWTVAMNRWQTLTDLTISTAKLPMTYAGGAATIKDVELTHQHSNGKVDITVGSALDIFGGTGMTIEELVKWNQRG